MKGISSEKIAVVIPTYNETKNIPVLLDKIFSILPWASIIIVDDSAITIQKELQKKINKYQQHIQFIPRSAKQGRGSAVQVGMEAAIKNKKIEYVFEMDADLTHDPKEFPSFLLAVNTADCIIGSRYIPGSSIEKWPKKRLITSKIVNIILTMWFGIKIHDYTSGFRLYSRNAAVFLASRKLHEPGFIALSETIYAIHRNNMRIKEIPFRFTDRLYGVSSAGFSEHYQALKGAVRIKFRSR